MRSTILPGLCASVAALALGAAFAPMAGASGHTVGTAGVTQAGQLQHQARTAASCYSQRANDNGVGIISQNFESTFDAYDSQGADDFKLTKKCKLKSVTADGMYFNGSGPANSFNVTIFKGKTKPGGIIVDCQNASYTDSGFGTPTVKCRAALRRAPGLQQIDKGKYWLSVQSNMNFSSGGEWGWNTNNTDGAELAIGSLSKWQNPGDGFGTGCTSWSDTITCIPSGEGGDFSFQLN